MFQRMIRQAALCGMAALWTSTATAQFFPGQSFDPCAPAVPVAATTFTQVAAVPQQCVTTCTPALVPVAQTVYQTVPVTEYQEVKRTVQRPVVETRYVDQEVTAYRPVTETRVAEVPTVAYQNVTEYKTVTRDMGQWMTMREYVPQLTPCQYDPRPGLFGSLNRFGYSLRSAFTPNYRTRRQYLPNYVAQTIPVTRQVAIPGTKQVTYNVTKLEPYKTTRKVAVNSVRMVAEEVTQLQPVTVMRTVPTGTRLAYVPPTTLGTATALGAQNGAVASGEPTPVRSRTADARNAEHFDRSRPASGNNYDPNKGKDPFRRNSNTFQPSDDTPFPPTTQLERKDLLQNTSQVAPVTQYDDLWEEPIRQPSSPVEPARLEVSPNAKPLTGEPPQRFSRTIPSIVRVNQWSKTSDATPRQSAPRQTPGISVAVD